MANGRWMLAFRARIMRFLMGIGMAIHRSWAPHPPSPTFTRWIPSTLSSNSGSIRLSIYVPRDYESRRKNGFKSVRSGAGHACIINFHGGGFTLGASTDDGRFIQAALTRLDCVVISVDYRLAPEFPFPTAVEDGADAVLWAAEHAEELGIDPHSLAITGFSSGGNLTLTVPVRLHDHLNGIRRPILKNASASPLPSPRPLQLKIPTTTVHYLAASASAASLTPATAVEPESLPLHTSSHFHRPASIATTVHGNTPSFTVLALAPFYPPTNYNQTRADRRATNPSPAHDLPPGLTELFDKSYLHPMEEIALDNAYISPGLMSASEMREVYGSMPVFGVGCEYDMLAFEGGEFARRLRKARRGEDFDGGDEEGENEVDDGRGESNGVTWGIANRVAHGWDKRPFLSAEVRAGIQREYHFVLDRLEKVFDAKVAAAIEED